MTLGATHRTIDAVFRIESPRLIAGLVRMVRDVGLAEELAQDSLVRALEEWPASGVPENPGAWLMTTAKNKAIDALRKTKRGARKYEELGREEDRKHEIAGAAIATSIEHAIDEDVGDDLLRLIFIACHDVLSREARVALTLRLLGGLTVDEIARASLVSNETIAQRIVRAKKALSDAKVPFEMPPAEARLARIASVLEVIYLIFNEGYAATSGDSVLRKELCEDGLRLGRVLAELAPEDAEVHGLVALMEIQASRSAARVDAIGNPVLLLEQNRATWDHALIRRGLAALDRADALVPPHSRGPYALQAAIAACHARANRAEDTDWKMIASLYGVLGAIMPSPIVELNRAVAVSRAEGPLAGLAIADALRNEPTLLEYHLLPSVRGDLLAQLGRLGEARVELERAAALAKNERDRAHLLARAAGLNGARDPSR